MEQPHQCGGKSRVWSEKGKANQIPLNFELELELAIQQTSSFSNTSPTVKNKCAKAETGQVYSLDTVDEPNQNRDVVANRTVLGLWPSHFS